MAFCQATACYHAEIPSHSPAPLRHRLWRSFYDRIAFAYDDVLDWADRLRISSERRVRAEVIAGLYLPAGAHVIDVGCGTAANFEFLPSGISYVGVDLSAKMLQVAKFKLQLKSNPALILTRWLCHFRKTLRLS
jgi:ubiquinone/menaquinone biosynthesis C-methylase UbiE